MGLGPGSWCRKLQLLGTKTWPPSTFSTLVFSQIPGLVLGPDISDTGVAPYSQHQLIRVRGILIHVSSKTCVFNVIEFNICEFR